MDNKPYLLNKNFMYHNENKTYRIIHSKKIVEKKTVEKVKNFFHKTQS